MKNIFRLIDRVVRGIASEKEIQAFNERLENDPTFQQLFDKYVAFDVAFHISDVSEEEENQERKRRLRNRVLSLAGILLLLSGAFWWLLPTLPAPQRRQADLQDTTKKQAKPAIDPAPVRQDTQKTARKTLPTPSRRQDSLPAPITPQDSAFLPQNPIMNQEAENAAEGGRRGIIKINVIAPKNNAKFSEKAVFVWENDKRELAYTLKLYDRKGTLLKKYQVQPREPLTQFEIDVRGFEPALYFWKLEHPTEEQPFTGKILIKAP